MSDTTLIQSPFGLPGDHEALEIGTALTPRFDANGLITAVVTDAKNGDVLMLAHMNADALAQTISTGIATYWSRSRAEIWIKGATSGNAQRVEEMRIDCDQDAVLLKVTVDGHGASCHRGYRSCFYRTIPIGGDPAEATLTNSEAATIFNPEVVYGTPHGHK
jgi:phosphoribosyl-AMP cyclohydrolase